MEISALGGMYMLLSIASAANQEDTTKELQHCDFINTLTFQLHYVQHWKSDTEKSAWEEMSLNVEGGVPQA